MALAHALTIWILTFRESSYKTMMENVLGMKYGQEQITQKNYYDFVNGSIDPFKTIKIDSFESINFKLSRLFESSNSRVLTNRTLSSLREPWINACRMECMEAWDCP
jgi:hypothetical protein